jgi:ABC-type branched-subunit amino acid transport system substrate-binding protein
LLRRGPLLGLGQALRRAARPIFALGVAASVAACSGLNFGNFGFGGGTVDQSAAGGDVIGTGSVRVALLISESADGHAGDTARAFRSAAELAIRDFPDAGIQIAVYDTKGTPAGAGSAVATALQNGAGIVLGPVFANEVLAIAQQTRASGVPVVAFSSDAGVAGPGVYLLSFLPADDVNSIVSFSASQGRKSFAALLPANAYGQVVEAALRSVAAKAGGRIVTVQTYASADEARAKAGAIASMAREIDALLIPDSGDVVPLIATTLHERGVTRDKVKLLGSGQWDDPRILNNPAMVGSWFPAPVKQGFDQFANRYRAVHGAPPPRNATLAYDATVLAIGIVRQYGADRFQNSVLTSPNGFAGIDGIFRFLPSGLTERRLAIYEVNGAGANIISPAARSFAGGQLAPHSQPRLPPKSNL